MTGEPLPRLHLLTNTELARQGTLVARASAVALAGVALHARTHDLPADDLIGLARRFAALTTTMFVNDRADVALMTDAAGLHLPEQGLPYAAARHLVGPATWIGRSVHDAESARRAVAEGADYVFLGPIWPTTSHPDRSPLGLAAIRAAQPARVIAIGGVTPARVAECLAAGAYGVAVLSAVWNAPDPGSVTREMLVSLESEG